MDKTKIEQQAKEIMDDFLEALGKIDDLPYEVGSERPSYMRDDITEKGIGDFGTEDFAIRMLDNAPKKKDGYVVAEKKKW